MKPYVYRIVMYEGKDCIAWNARHEIITSDEKRIMSFLRLAKELNYKVWMFSRDANVDFKSWPEDICEQNGKYFTRDPK